MKQEASVVKIVSIDDKKQSPVGKCCMCSRHILNDPEEFWCSETRLIGNKHYCGGCLLELAPIINEVKESFDKEMIKGYNEGYFYSIDQATGRMVTNDG